MACQSLEILCKSGWFWLSVRFRIDGQYWPDLLSFFRRPQPELSLTSHIPVPLLPPLRFLTHVSDSPRFFTHMSVSPTGPDTLPTRLSYSTSSLFLTLHLVPLPSALPSHPHSLPHSMSPSQLPRPPPPAPPLPFQFPPQ